MNYADEVVFNHRLINLRIKQEEDVMRGKSCIKYLEADGSMILKCILKTEEARRVLDSLHLG